MVLVESFISSLQIDRLTRMSAEIKLNFEYRLASATDSQAVLTVCNAIDRGFLLPSAGRAGDGALTIIIDTGCYGLHGAVTAANFFRLSLRFLKPVLSTIEKVPT